MNLNTNKKNKIKLVIYLIIVMVMGTIAPFFPSSSEFKAAGTGSLVDWYGLWGSDIRFDSKTQLLTFVTKAKKAASNSSVRFNTIGWQVRFEPTDGSPNFYTRTKPYFTRLHDNVEGGVTYVYSEWVIPLAPHPDYSGSILECLVRDYGSMDYTMDNFVTMLSHGAVLKFDSIISILEANTMEPNAYVDEKGDVKPNSKAPVASRRGEYYLTKTGSTYATNHHIKSGWTAISNYDMSKGGIAGARTWSNTAMFDDLFDKPAYIQIEEVLMPKTVKTSHFTTIGEKLAPIQIVETVELKKGETVDVTVTGLSFPGYKIHHSAFNYKGTGSADSKDTQYGDSSITRTIPVTTDNVEHYIYYYYEKTDDVPDPMPTGNIVFTPNESKVIPNNNNGWVKNDISVTVATIGIRDKRIKG